jgi:hydroxyacylglutathione hydrolase
MILEQYYTKCLAQGTYYIASNGEAAIIDPLREVQQYIDRAKEDSVTITYIFLTHFHADFVSGHVDLADKTREPVVAIIAHSWTYHGIFLLSFKRRKR